ncbi:unnamed protein product [Cyprideis torosa]|uniref:Uncharacterized protein n=1 Tax=Cyprideis torosa TaxID=163714 RepID=A0A7R8WFP5_9CRUS|nr:unnamed protein product [Cyprideis torosa]CAG0892087.1 unnamed protein product [Cyprideis torosa]
MLDEENEDCFQSIALKVEIVSRHVLEFSSLSAEDLSDLGTFCGSVTPSTISSSKDSLQVLFASDGSLAYSGFRAEYVVVGCGGVLRKDSGFFVSPNYPNAYPSNTICEWQIVTPLGSAIELTINGYDIESANNCTYDSLQVSDGMGQGEATVRDIQLTL